ncbi:HD domain-containing protein [uncultured Bacteroides sp.]|uniref:HD domain-containing protein n=1 Tax=uncultured Bacteroides sp. TaxID=162156 RepID=UPI00261ECD49|nr:HD domain-containing protein [uncultured Bacteroides sp.]
MINKALEIACRVHAGQTDKGGHPYIWHPVRVALHCDSEEEKVVALLHDVVEDTPVTLEALKAEGFSMAVLDALKCLTKIKGEEYMDFIRRVAGNELAVKVKIQDLKDNMDVSRLGGKKHWKMDLYSEALRFLTDLHK